MKKTITVLILAVVATSFVFAGGSSEKKPVVIVWYPNESGEELKPAREEYAKIIEKAIGRKAEHKLTTDYAISIETIANKNAHIGYFGAQGYIQAHDKNPKVLPLFVNSGASGTLKDAVYYSWLSVKRGNEGAYMSGSSYSIDNIKGRRFSFVSNSSTSGFKVPSTGIVSYFKKKSGTENITQADLLEGGAGKFFKQVLFGGSHQGSAVNLLLDKVDIAAFCDTCVANYVDFASGTENRPGAVYRVKKDAAEPFNAVPEAEFVLISVTPVLNAPFIYNADLLSEEEVGKLRAAFTSDETTKNPNIFVPKGSKFKGLFKQPERFLKVEDAWFDPIRELSK